MFNFKVKYIPRKKHTAIDRLLRRPVIAKELEEEAEEEDINDQANRELFRKYSILISIGLVLKEKEEENKDKEDYIQELLEDIDIPKKDILKESYLEDLILDITLPFLNNFRVKRLYTNYNNKETLLGIRYFIFKYIKNLDITLEKVK